MMLSCCCALSINSVRLSPTIAKQTPAASERRKGSSQLIRWSRARAIKSGVKLKVVDQITERISGESSSEEEEGCLAEMEDSSSKHIYMVSDGTGWTAEHAVNAALGQFDYCLVDRACPVNTHLFSGVGKFISINSTVVLCCVVLFIYLCIIFRLMMLNVLWR